MPQMTMPGTTSRVCATTMSSAEFMSRAPMPGALCTMPSFWSRFTPASWHWHGSRIWVLCNGWATLPLREQGGARRLVPRKQDHET